MASSDFRLELNSAGVRELLKSPEVQADLARRAGAIAAQASQSGGQFGSNVQVGATRARAIAFTADAHAQELEARDRVLTRAVDAGRG